MAESVLVVEINASVRVVDVRGNRRDLKAGTYAIERSIIEPSLRAMPDRRLRALDRVATEEEIRASTEAGLIEPATGTPDDVDDRPLASFSKAELVEAAATAGVATAGTKADLVARITEAAEALDVDPDLPGAALVEAIASHRDEADD